MEKRVIITQSNYIPWKGYFDAIRAADTFVIYDEMQFTRRDWRNRNMIKTPQGSKWLTIPVEVKGKYFQKISETKISEKGWNETHWKTIVSNYSKAPFFGENREYFENLYMTATSEWLHEINIHFMKGIAGFLDIKTEFLNSADFELHEDRNMRLLNICKALDATDYFSGPAAKAYMDIKLFESEGIDVHFFDFSGYPEYKQLYPPFEHSVSVLDLIFNTGKAATDYMKEMIYV